MQDASRLPDLVRRPLNGDRTNETSQEADLLRGFAEGVGFEPTNRLRG